MRSWLSRESFSTRRPTIRIGTITTGMPSTISMASFGLVTINMIMAPASITRLRSATDALEPTTVWISSVSAVSRLSSSPVRVVS
jgi:hypothetical protein